MDGSSITGLAGEVSITATGLLVLLGILVMLGVAALGILSHSLRKHLTDCSAHRARFHRADRRMERKLAAMATNVEWLIRNAGHQPVPMPSDELEDDDE